MARADITPLERNETGIAEAIGMLRHRFGDRLDTGAAMRGQHAHSTSYLPAQPPDAVAFARSTEEVREIVRICAAHRAPIIPFGAGTSVEGGVNAPAGGICLDISGMDRIARVNAEDLDAVVEAGVTREALNVHLRDTGLFFPVDPGANATLGGMASTRASGTSAVRYGTMRDNVVNVTAVLPDGSVFTSAGRARKSSSGYDLTRLLVGSEGTLGVITGLTVRLQGIPEAMAAATCSFPDVEAACNATIMTLQAGIPVARIELLDRASVAAINSYARTRIPETPLLLLEFHGTTAGVREQSELFGEIAADFGGSGFEWVENAEERSRLWKARHQAYFAFLAAVPGSQAIPTDACVPISRLADCVRETAADVEETGIFGPIMGHVGDGNFHVSLFIDPDDPVAVGKSEGVLQRLSARALAMEGTCTGEHGIGQGKRAWLRREHGVGADVMALIKNAIDPLGIMNPGKVLAP